MSDRKMTAEQRIARFDPGSLDAGLRGAMTGAGIVSEAARILPFSLLSAPRLRGVMRAVGMLGDMAGDTAEIGCNAGGTSRLIALLNGGRRHWACDTFEGLVDVGQQDAGRLSNGAFTNRLAKFEGVAARLADLNVRVSQGYFPKDASPEMRSAKYAFVHIDVDTYRSIHSCFEFFACRMASGGIIAMDDVIGRGTPGAKAAWIEILAGRNRRWDVVEQNDPAVTIRFA